MRFQKPLDAILRNPARVRVLRFLCRKGGEWSGRRIAAGLGMNPVTAHKALRALHEEAVLDLRKVGSNFLYSLRDDHCLIRRLLRPLFREESRLLQHLLDALRQQLSGRLRSRIVAAAVYGSVARGQERPGSDIDLFVVVSSEKAKRDVQQSAGRLWEKISKEFGNPLSVHVNTASELQQKIRRGLPLFREILRHHHLVWGQSLSGVLQGK